VAKLKRKNTKIAATRRSVVIIIIIILLSTCVLFFSFLFHFYADVRKPTLINGFNADSKLIEFAFAKVPKRCVSARNSILGKLAIILLLFSKGK